MGLILDPHNTAYNSIFIYILIIIVINLMNPSYLYAGSDQKQINIYKLSVICIAVYILFMLLAD